MFEAPPDATGTTSFTISNNGDAALDFNVSASGDFGGGTQNFVAEVEVGQKLATVDRTSHRGQKLHKSGKSKIGFDKRNKIAKSNASPPAAIQGDDVLFNDDGDD